MTAPARHLSLLFLCLTVSLARAHDPGLSTATLQLRPDSIQATLTFALKDAQQLQPQGAIISARLAKLAAQEFQTALDGKTVLPDSADCGSDAQGNVEIILKMPRVAATNLSLRSVLLHRLPLGHRQYLEVRGPGTGPITQRLLSATEDSAMMVLPASSQPVSATPTAPAAAFLKMGVNHILTGYDHLLFLFGLLVAARRVGSALKIITCFTVAHSITLAVATLSPVPAPSKYVEPLIAASIAYIGVENLLCRGEPKGRWLLTFGFGLVHGCGFASALREFGVGANDAAVALPLVSFNLGVELGQILIAALVLPMLWKLRKNAAFARRCLPASSVVVALLGGFWFVQRIWFA